jgi:hypothetical protein
MPKSALICAVIVALAMPLATNAAPLRQEGGNAAGWQASKVIKAAVPDKQGRVTVSCPVASTLIDDKAFQGQKGYLVLQDPAPQVSMEEALKHPELRDRLEIRIAPAVLDRLKRLGIRDVAAHFQGRTVRVTGKSTSVLYLCFPAIAVTTVVVERIDDIEVIEDKAPSRNIRL